MPYSTHLDQNHFLMIEIVTWNIPLSNGKSENSLLGVWFWGSVSHFRSRPFVTGSYGSSVWWRNWVSACPLHSLATVGLCMDVFWNITMKSLHFSVMWLINKCVSVHHAGWTAWKGFTRFIQPIAYTKCWRLLASQRQVEQLGWMTLKEMHAWFICVWTQQ